MAYLFVLDKLDLTERVVSLLLREAIIIEVVIKLMYFDPIEEKNKPFPADVPVRIKDDDELLETAKTDAQGVVTFKKRDYHGKEVCFEVDFSGREYLDIENVAMVAKKDLQPGDNRRVFRLPEVWKSRDCKKFHDDREGKFEDGVIKDLAPGKLGTPAQPWEIVVNHEWDWFHLKYEYYNGDDLAVAALPRGILVEAFDEETFTDDDFLGAATPLNDDGIVAIGIMKKGYDKEDVYLQARCGKDRYLKTDQKKVTHITETSFAKLNYPVFLKRYPLPEIWKSQNQRAKFGTDIKTYEEWIEGKPETTKGKPLTFFLDDFVLVKENGSPVPWAANTPFTVFDRRLTIRNPETNEPYLTKNNPAVNQNYFDGDQYFYVDGKEIELSTRAIRVERDFYDLGNQRTTKGKVIGVRAAVLNDHPHQLSFKDPINRFTGHFDLHYFHDCCGHGAERVSHLLVHWCAKYSPDGVTAADITNFEKLGTIDTGIRLEGKHPSDTGRGANHKEYILRPHRKPGDPAPNPARQVRMRFHLSARKSPPIHCDVRVYNPAAGARDSMGQHSADFSKGNYQEDTTDTYVDAADGLSHAWYTMAHEFGHAVGLPDEYLEPVADPTTGHLVGGDWVSPVLPRFDQERRVLPCSVGDEYRISLMAANKALRLRHFWQFATWLNHKNDVQKLLDNEKYGIEYKISAAKDLRYFLPPSYDNYFQPAVKDLGFQNHKTGTMDLLLYKVGQEETQYNVKNGACLYDSVLVVRLKMHYAFVTNADGLSFGGWTSRRDALKLFQQKAAERFNGRKWGAKVFTVESATGDFRKCLVYFLPVFDVSPAAPGDAHFNVRVRLPAAAAADNRMDLKKFTKVYINGLAARPGKTVEIVKNANQVSLFRYCLGLPAARKVAGTNKWETRFRKSDLEFLKTWMESQWPGHLYTVKKY